MRSNLRIATLMAFGCAHLSFGALLAKPTHPTVRDTSRKNAAVAPVARETSHNRAPHYASSHPIQPHPIQPHPISSHPTFILVAAHRGGHLTTAKWVHPTSRPSSAMEVRRAGRPAILARVEANARSSYAAGTAAAAPAAPADAATIDRVHAWELTHRNPPRTTPLPQEDAATKPSYPEGTVISPSVLNDDDASSNLVRTNTDLPRTRSIEEEASAPVILPSLYDQRGRLVVPAPLYGSHEVLLHQNQMADRDGLDRVRDDADLLDLRRDHKLVPLPVNETLRVDDRLPYNRRYSRPWTADFLTVLARNFYASFHEPLQVNSAVRTVDFQRRLLRTNGNAAPATGDTASPHLTGQAVDIGKGGLSRTEIAWMRTYLQPLIDQGKIDVEEEFQQACFHISVYRNYLAPARPTMASTHPSQSGHSY